MLNVTLDTEHGIATLEPHGPLTKADFSAASETIDPYIAEHGSLRGLMISTPDFPGWDSFAGLVSHIEFVRDHHRKLSRVAIVTDSRIGDFAETIAKHFVAAEIRHFPAGQVDAARDWLRRD